MDSRLRGNDNWLLSQYRNVLRLFAPQAMQIFHLAQWLAEDRAGSHVSAALHPCLFSYALAFAPTLALPRASRKGGNKSAHFRSIFFSEGME